MTSDSPLTFYEFFAGGGMARIGLGSAWSCLFANDMDPRKLDVYAANFGDDDLVPGDVWGLDALDLPGQADLAWASFPCQDVSLAGKREGLMGERTSAFYGFWRMIETLREEGRAPRLIVLENVSGVLTSNRGEDFRVICELLAGANYRIGALELDAAAFTPHSRPRLFVIASLGAGAPPLNTFDFAADARAEAFGRTDAVRAAAARLPAHVARHWVWWRLPTPPLRNTRLVDILEHGLADTAWHDGEQTATLVNLMDARHRQRVESARSGPGLEVGAVFRRTRMVKGERVQRAEVRFDGLAGCLRTPAGGSSRQFIVVCGDGQVRSRALTPRETARLMGLPDEYILPVGATAALHVTGDGVSAPVVSWLADHLLEPLARASAPAAVA